MPTQSRFLNDAEEKEYESITYKCCSKCGVSKPLSEYQNNTSGSQPYDRDGNRYKRPECKPCQKTANAGKREAEKFAKQAGITKPDTTNCELCIKNISKGKIIFDHDHVTNRFRGWLCDPCNRSLGILGDTVESISNAVNYLNKYNAFHLKIEDNKIVTEKQIAVEEKQIES